MLVEKNSRFTEVIEKHDTEILFVSAENTNSKTIEFLNSLKLIIQRCFF